MAGAFFGLLALLVGVAIWVMLIMLLVLVLRWFLRQERKDRRAEEQMAAYHRPPESVNDRVSVV
ncbi:MAG: hypothetical protein E7Z96_05320 [Actinomycetaceae bacterium]|nr:hypothetical protein [Actinomycetaceae bacterium]